MTEKLRIGFMGTPDFAVAALDAIAETDHELVAIYCQPPKPAGRGKKLHKTPVHLRGEDLGVPVYHPKSLKKEEAQQEFADLNLDIAIVAAYGLILPKAVLDAPKYGCLNIHGSILPRWRGAAPIQRAILAGDTETGICIMQMDEGLDTGDVLLEEATAITNETTASTLHDTLAEMGGRMVVDVINQIASGNAPTPTPQTEDGMTYAKMLSREEGEIDWTQDAKIIERQCRALTPWPGVWYPFEDGRVKVLKASLADGTGEAGEILDKYMTVACGTGALRLEIVQPAGRKKMDGLSYLNGSDLTIGDKIA